MKISLKVCPDVLKWQSDKYVWWSKGWSQDLEHDRGQDFFSYGKWNHAWFSLLQESFLKLFLNVVNVLTLLWADIHHVVLICQAFVSPHRGLGKVCHWDCQPLFWLDCLLFQQKQSSCQIPNLQILAVWLVCLFPKKWKYLTQDVLWCNIQIKDLNVKYFSYII